MNKLGKKAGKFAHGVREHGKRSLVINQIVFIENFDTVMHKTKCNLIAMKL